MKFIDNCAVCKQGVLRTDMVYLKSVVFHINCFEKFGSFFPTPDRELTTLNARTRIDLVQLKNLRVRIDAGQIPGQIKKSKARRRPKVMNRRKNRPKKIKRKNQRRF
jgi:hypothetical protein